MKPSCYLVSRDAPSRCEKLGLLSHDPTSLSGALPLLTGVVLSDDWQRQREANLPSALVVFPGYGSKGSCTWATNLSRNANLGQRNGGRRGTLPALLLDRRLAVCRAPRARRPPRHAWPSPRPSFETVIDVFGGQSTHLFGPSAIRTSCAFAGQPIRDGVRG